MPSLDFKGKQFIYTHHLSVPFRTLEVDGKKSLPAKGAKPSLDDNLIIHGDNLHALKALLPTHAGKIDCIYIDPPYNTGNEGWVYNDAVNSPLMREWLKSANPVDREDLERHDKWLSMMWPRLRMLCELLADKGTLFVSIGDHEVHRLRMVMDEIFGQESFVATFVWKARAKPSNIGEKKKKAQQVSEYVLCYTKGVRGEDKVFGLLASGEDRSYPHTLGKRRYRLQTILKSIRGENERHTMRFEVAGYTPPPEQRWQGGQAFIQRLYDTGYVEFRDGVPFMRYFEDEEDPEHNPLYTFVPPKLSGTAEHGKIELNQILGVHHGLDTVKPLSLIRWLTSFSTTPESIILDSFAGSGTTAHAVLELNKQDGGSRRFILVECEDYADKLTAERVRRVIKGYKFEGMKSEVLWSLQLTATSLKRANELLEKANSFEMLDGPRFDRICKVVDDGVFKVFGEKQITETVERLGSSFTYCELGPEINVDGMLTGKKLPDYASLARYVFYTATGRTLQKDVSAPRKDWLIGETEMHRLYLIYKPDREWLRSNDAALNATTAAAMQKSNKSKTHCLVFAAVKFIGQKELSSQYDIEFCQLPYAIHRILGD